MKKTATILLAFMLSIISLNLSAYEGIKYNLNSKNRSFTLAPLENTDDGIKGKIMITAGAGFNLLGFNLETRYLFSSYYNYEGNIVSSRSLPMFNVGVDYGLIKRVSVGVAFGYQTAKVTLQNIEYYGDRHYDTWRRIHAAIRGDYYIVAKENISLYTGAKFGLNLYTVSTTVPAYLYPDYLDNMGVYPSVVSVQAHFGFSYFFGGRFGFNTEVGIGYGGPYIFHAGLTVKI